jgi:hypothetical protein
MSTVIGSWLRAGRRRRAQLGLQRVAIALSVAACNHAPTMDLVGSYFLAWILCGAVGIVAAVIISQILALAGINDYVVAGRQFHPVSAILDLRAHLAGHALTHPTQDAHRAHHQALAACFRHAASWTRSGEGAGEVADGLPEPPILSGPGDQLTALATWYGVLHQNIRGILDEVGPQPQPVIDPSVGNALHAAG